MKQTFQTLGASQVNDHSDPLDDLPVAYVELDARGAITRANRLSRSLHSLDTGELIGKPAWELMPVDEREQSCATMMTAMETGQDPPVARRSIYTSSGAFRVHELHRNLIRDAHGQPVGMRVVTVDVTDAHKAREQAERSSLWLESVLASMGEAVIVTDALGFIRTINSATEELFGWKAEELTGKAIERALPVLKFVSGNDAKAHLDFTMALEQRTTGIAIILDHERREVTVKISTSPIIDKESGFTAGVVSIICRVEEAG
ncbi:MAG: PAS domain-containing protein [Terracidiphilus sp.]|jgi:PAS domain S-box-containing protein